MASLSDIPPPLPRPSAEDFASSAAAPPLCAVERAATVAAAPVGTSAPPAEPSPLGDSVLEAAAADSARAVAVAAFAQRHVAVDDGDGGGDGGDGGGRHGFAAAPPRAAAPPPAGRSSNAAGGGVPASDGDGGGCGADEEADGVLSDEANARLLAAALEESGRLMPLASCRAAAEGPHAVAADGSAAPRSGAPESMQPRVAVGHHVAAAGEEGKKDAAAAGSEGDGAEDERQLAAALEESGRLMGVAGMEAARAAVRRAVEGGWDCAITEGPRQPPRGDGGDGVNRVRPELVAQMMVSPWDGMAPEPQCRRPRRPLAAASGAACDVRGQEERGGRMEGAIGLDERGVGVAGWAAMRGVELTTRCGAEAVMQLPQRWCRGDIPQATAGDPALTFENAAEMWVVAQAWVRRCYAATPQLEPVPDAEGAAVIVVYQLESDVYRKVNTWLWQVGAGAGGVGEMAAAMRGEARLRAVRGIEGDEWRRVVEYSVWLYRALARLRRVVRL